MTALTRYVLKTTDESRFDETAGYVNDGELTLSLDANTAYWIEVGVECHTYSDFASRMQVVLAYSGTLDAAEPHHIMTFRSYTAPLTVYQSQAVGSWTTDPSVIAYAAIVDTNYSEKITNRGQAWFTGRLTTDTAGDLTVQWAHLDNGSSGSGRPSSVKAGSWMYATPLNICPI
jgi:hypothetical protein